MKKKILAITLCVAMLAVMLVSGTLAYFTDEDQATNTFTTGNVKISQHEWQRNEDTQAIEEFEDNQNVFPAVHEKLQPKSDITVEGYTFPIRKLAGNYVDKIVNVKNEGTEEAYIRTIIAVPSMNGWDDDLDASENPLHWNYLDASDFSNGIGWDWNGSNDDEATAQLDWVEEVDINGIEYDLYIATYNEAVPANSWTSPSMVGFYLDNDINCDEKGYYQFEGENRRDLSPYITIGQDGKATLEILVATQACQTEGFDDAWEALDEAFGDITATNHPWATPAP